MRVSVNKNDSNFVETLYDRFSIKDVEDIYPAIGKIIQQSQEWEMLFRELCSLCGAKVDDLEISTLNRMNNELFRNKVFDEKKYNKLREIISLRNYINHIFFTEKGWSFPFNEVEETLNSISYLIFEGMDFIGNKIDEIKGSNGKRPTLVESNTKIFVTK